MFNSTSSAVLAFLVLFVPTTLKLTEQNSSVLKMRKKGGEYHLILLNGKSFEFYHPFEEEFDFKKDQIYRKFYPNHNPVLFEVPRGSNNLFISANYNCRVPFVCVLEGKNPKLRFLNDHHAVA